MASNLFGNLITNETLKELSKYIGKKVAKRDKAKIAMQMKNEENKDVSARRYVEKLKTEWGSQSQHSAWFRTLVGIQSRLLAATIGWGISDLPHTRQRLEVASGVGSSMLKDPEQLVVLKNLRGLPLIVFSF
ncbi:hypothetical protein SLE2022_132830 [Rubroshorea leprosula]